MCSWKTRHVTNCCKRPIKAMRPSLSCSLKTRLQHSTWRRPRTNIYCICKYFYFDLPFSLDKSKEVDEKTAKKCEAFICDLYPSYKKSPKTADELRYIIFCKRSLTVRLYHQPLTACDNTSTVQTTRRTFGEKASMPYSSSHLPKDAGGKKKMMSWR